MDLEEELILKFGVVRGEVMCEMMMLGTLISPRDHLLIASSERLSEFFNSIAPLFDDDII